MNTISKVIASCGLLLALPVLSGCAKQPTQLTEIRDLRPLVSFNVTGSAQQMTLYVDGQTYGPISQYLYPQAAVRLLAGEHLIEVRHGQSVIYSETRYFSEGLDYTIQVGR